MSRDPEKAATQFFGGRVCLDFANTMDWRVSDSPQELIPDYNALLSWSARRGVLTTSTATRLRALGIRKPGLAADVLASARALRTDIWDTLENLRLGSDVQLEPFNSRLSVLPPQPILIHSKDCFVYDLPGVSLEEPMWPVLWSFSAVLTSDDARRVGCCQAAGCGWFFVDESPNRTRRWCSSEVCGNRERARRAYAKRRNAPNEDSL